MDELIRRRHVAAMEEYDLDGLVAYAQENVAYGAGYTVPSQAVGIRNRQFAVVTNRHGDAGMLLTENELQEAQSRSTISDLRPYDEFVQDPMVTLASLIHDLGLSEARIGLEMNALPVDRWDDLRPLLPRATWVHGTKAFERARMIKTPGELEHLRRAASIADLAQADTHASVRAGMTEQDLYRLISDRALARGAETIAMIQVAAGERSSYSNPTPSLRTLQSGDTVKVDVFVTSGGYWSDTGRAIVIDEATDEQREIWARMQEALSAVYQLIAPGVRTSDLWNAFTSSFARHDMQPAIRFLGHGLGLSLHEEPFIAAHTDTVLEPGMVLAIEPVYRVGNIGYHLEDNVIVTEHGMENMTNHFGDELLVLGERAQRVA